MTVRRLTPQDAHPWRRIRLEMLREAPTADASNHDGSTAVGGLSRGA